MKEGNMKNRGFDAGGERVEQEFKIKAFTQTQSLVRLRGGK